MSVVEKFELQTRGGEEFGLFGKTRTELSGGGNQNLEVFDICIVPDRQQRQVKPSLFLHVAGFVRNLRSTTLLLHRFSHENRYFIASGSARNQRLYFENSRKCLAALSAKCLATRGRQSASHDNTTESQLSAKPKRPRSAKDSRRFRLQWSL